MSTLSLPALKRWSCVDSQLPSVESVKSIHVYDFDNTLFNSPLPNPQLWHGLSIGALQGEDALKNGGWWHDPEVLSSTGEGLEKEEPRAWAGWWNETIVELVKVSMEQRSALAVLLTGRSERRFSELISRIVKSRSLRFDMVVLKPEVGPADEKFPSTMSFKQAFLTHLIKVYNKTEEFKIYEDRPKHVKGFGTFLAEFKEQNPRDQSSGERALEFEVIPVAAGSTTLDPLVETVQVQKMINIHNSVVLSGRAPPNTLLWSLRRQVLFSGYLIDPTDTARLLSISNLAPGSTQEDGLRTMANNVVISPRALTAPLKDKVGGLGAKLRWKVIALGMYEKKVWAARVEPVPITAEFYVESTVPHIPLARKWDGKPSDAGRIQQWSPIPPDKQIEFDTIVGEKVLLRLEHSSPPKKQHKATHHPPSQGKKRSLPSGGFSEINQHRPPQGNENRPPQSGHNTQSHTRGHSNRGGRGGHRGARGPHRGPAGGSTGGRGGKKPTAYRSLDDEANKRPAGLDGTNEAGGLTY